MIDENPNSEYFRITEFKETFTGGKNGFLIEGSEFLKETTEVKIELIDVDGNPIYFEPGNGIPEYYEGTSKLVSVHIYDDTPIGLGKITILGELKNYVNSNGAVVPVPEEWKGVYNVKWERTFKINKNINNEDIVRFYKRPLVNIDEVVKPIFTKTIPNVTQTGLVSGIPQSPVYGTDLSNWRAGTVYKLKTDGNSQWTSSVDENEITVSVNGTDYTSTIIEVLNDREVLVDVPYTSNNIVENFTSQSYSTTFEYVEGQTITDSSLTGSFAKIDITQLKTFVGDVARVKVFRKSRATANDWQFVQESKLESTELLRDITTTSDTELSYGRFDESNLSTYWVTSSNDHPTSINVDKLNASVKVDYNTSLTSVQELKTVNTLPISQNVEYTLDFRTLLSGSVDSSKTLRAYLSSSNYQQDILTISGSTQYLTREQLSQNIIADNTHDAKLVFEFKGDDWYISNVSLKNAQDTSFSPDEFTLIQDIPRKLASETFDFRFEFYDINNNYIPVTVTASKTFNGGNDYTTTSKLLTFESDRNAFRFSTGSVQNPENQVVKFAVTQNGLTGSLTFASAAYDIGGNYLSPSNYSQYPGLLTSVTPAGALLTINNFTGSYNGIGDAPYVGSIIYTASIDDLNEYETVYRLEDGEDSPTLIVTSDANQFIYEPTTLSPKPSGQSITIRAQRKNLASYTTPITVNKSNTNAPDLNVGSTANGVTTYTLSATEFSSSFSANNFDNVTYSFTGSDVYGNNYSDEVTLSKVINFDGVSIVLSNESTTFPATSTGTVTGGFGDSSGSVQMFIGGTQIQHDDISGGRLKNTFDITSISGTNVTPTSTSPTNQYYSISGMTADSGSLTLNIEYLAGDSSTSQSFQKVVSYSKAKKGTPNVEIAVTPSAQTIEAKSNGSGSVSPQTLTVTALEGGTSRFTSIGTPTYSGGISGTVSTNTITFTDTASDMTSDTETITIPVNYTDSEGTAGTKNIKAVITRTRKAPSTPTFSLSPQAQTVESSSLGYGTPLDVLLTITEGGTKYTYDNTVPYGDSTFTIQSVTDATNNNDGSLTPDAITSDSTRTGYISFLYTTSEGITASNTHSLEYTISVAKQGQDGLPGDPGEPGEPGADGPGLTYVGDCGSLASSWVWVSDADSRHITSVDLSGTRRYYVLKPAANGVAKSTTGCPATYPLDDTYFTSLTTFASVATDLLLAKDATITRALTIGTFGTDEGVIRSANATDFTTGKGLWLDNTGDVRFGDPSGNYVSWDQSAGTLNITGDITITNTGDFADPNAEANPSTYSFGPSALFPLSTISTPTVSGLYLGSSNMGYYKTTAPAGWKTYMDNNGNFYLNGTAGSLAWVAASDTLSITGSITATSGEFGGITIASNKIYTGTGTWGNTNTGFYADDAGQFSLKDKLTWDGTNLVVSGSGTFTGTVTAGGVQLGPDLRSTDDGLKIDNDNFWYNSGTVRFQVGNPDASFKISDSGNLQVNVASGAAMSFYNTTAGTQGMTLAPGQIYLVPSGAGSGDPGNLNVGRGTISGDVTSGYLKISPTTAVQISGDLDVTGDINADGNITAFASSDKRLKDNIKRLENPLIKISKLGGYEFDWNENQSSYKGHDIGVIAQEVQSIIPEIVSEKTDGYLGVRYEKIVPLLIEGIKELTNKVESLENEILKLKENK